MAAHIEVQRATSAAPPIRSSRRAAPGISLDWWNRPLWGFKEIGRAGTKPSRLHHLMLMVSGFVLECASDTVFDIPHRAIVQEQGSVSEHVENQGDMSPCRAVPSAVVRIVVGTGEFRR